MEQNIKMKNVLEQKYKAVLVCLILVVWVTASWFGTKQKFESDLALMVASEQKRTQVMSDDVADSIRRNLHYVAGVPDTFEHALRVWKAVDKFGPDIVRTAHPKELAIERWAADAALDDLNQYLTVIQGSLGVDLIFVVNASGDAISASNWNKDETPIGTNYADRQWFAEARNGRRGMQYAMGKTTHRAGLYFSAPIMRNGRFTGAIVAKVELQALSFLTRQADTYVTDSNGVIILAHDADMVMKSVPGAAVRKLSDAEKHSIYQTAAIPELNIESWQQHETLMRINDEAFPHVLTSTALPEFGLTIHAESDMPSFFALERERYSNFILFSVLGIAAILISFAFFSLRRAKDIARESETRLRLILESANCGIWGQTSDGVCTFINAEAAKLLGYEASELIGKALHSVVHHSHANGSAYPRSDCPMFASGQDGIPRVASNEVLWRKDGSSFEVEYATSPIVFEGYIEGAVVIFNDVTERNQQARQLEIAKEKAEAANRAKSDFLANMSHEIRTPMNAVIGFSELAIESSSEEERSSFLQHILDSSKALLGILNDILDFSKIEAQQMTLENGVFQLDVLLENLNRMFTLRANEKGLVFTTDKAPDIPALLIGDQLRLRQILTNLLGNSIKFTSSGHVALSVSRLDSVDGSVLLDFCVKDTGIGMTPEQMESLFQPFQQADNSITRRFGGTGLGLSISRKLAQLMGGDISIQSEFGKGSEFRLKVRLAVAGKEEIASQVKLPDENISRSFASQNTENSLQGKRILLVEDNRMNQVLASRILDKFEVRLDIASHGEEAIRKLEGESYDVVLMDIQMPVMDGLEATRRIRLDERFKYLPIVAMSAGVTLDEQARCEEVGMTGFIGKPIDAVELKKKLIELCHLRSDLH
jgi:PAS domain S-box-containing protein